MGTIDSRVEKDENSPGNVMERRWYERNRHIFPAGKWDLFDRAKYYSNYRMYRGEIQKELIAGFLYIGTLGIVLATDYRML